MSPWADHLFCFSFVSSAYFVSPLLIFLACLAVQKSMNGESRIVNRSPVLKSILAVNLFPLFLRVLSVLRVSASDLLGALGALGGLGG